MGQTLRTKTLLRVVPITLLALGLVLLATHRIADKAVEREVESRLQSVADSAAASLSQDLDDWRNSALSLSKNGMIVNSVIDTEHRRGVVEPFFRNFRLPGIAFRQVALLDYRGRTLVSSNKERPVIVEPILGRVMNGEDVLHFAENRVLAASPVVYSGRPEGVIYIEYDQRELLSRLHSAVGGERLRLFHGDELIADSNLLERSEGDPWLRRSSPVPGYPALRIEQAETEASAFASQESMGVALIIASAAMILALLGAIALTSRMATRPLGELVDQISQIGSANDLQGTLPEPKGPEELRALRRSFNRMIRELSVTTVSRDRLAASDSKLRQANEELERTNSDLAQFAFVASHDLQEPLRKVNSFAELFQEELGDELSEDAALYLGFIMDGTVRMRSLIQDLLTFSRMGAVETARDRVDLNAVVGDVLDTLSLTIEERGAVVTMDPLPECMGDSGQLGHLLQNLIANGIKYCEAEPPTVHVGVEHRGDERICYVRDNGIGIEPAYHDLVFGVFKRLHGRETYSGTGIGLAICHRIVDRMGGRIWVESTGRDGSTFLFTIEPAEHEVDRPPAVTPSHRSLRTDPLQRRASAS